MNAPIANVKPGCVAIFNCGRYHNQRDAMTKVRPVLVLAVRGERAFIIPLSTKPNFTPGEPCYELSFSLRQGTRSFAKVMLLESVPLNWLLQVFNRETGTYWVPEVTEVEIEAIRRLVIAVTSGQCAVV